MNNNKRNTNSSHNDIDNSNNDNTNSTNSDISTASSSLSLGTSELGEVKTALGRLYKEFESFKLSQKTEREKDRAELQAWAQTNLIQNQLLSQAMATIELLTQELKNQGVSWHEYERSNADLRQELTLLLSQFQNTPKSSPTLESLELKGLKSEISDLKGRWTELVNHTNKLTTAIQELEKSPLRTKTIEKEVFPSDYQAQSYVVMFGTTFFTLAFFVIVNQFIPMRMSPEINSYLSAIWERTGWTNTKLERVEKKLGTEPK
ncbi:hypothetical protein VB713_12585 [Anabaena cylindrica UHCC 0172]|uniref:hypothetical protein n=1 Tax=Anabaena cylindrica TaxID=1165 RepID=UPI002B21ACCB|nr:hypothetical protein [Anabaena cylindrica]MEA5551787.1 hypothetical protein [Anabaena cylindrica UHCC 0172]